MNGLKDPALPGLSAALDTDQVLEWLRASSRESGDELQLLALSIVNVQYKPRRRCAVLYTLKYRRDDQGRSHKLPLAGVLLPAGEPGPVPPSSLLGRLQQSGLCPLRRPVLQLPRMGMVLQAFPLDADLPSLPDALDPVHMRGRLGRLWKRHGVRVRRVSAGRLGYTPGARVALRYDVNSEFTSTGLPESRRLVGKIDAARQAAQIFMRSWSLWRAAAGRPGLAPPVGYDVPLNLYLQEWVNGSRLADLAGCGDFIKPVRQTARTLAMLHELRVPIRSCRTADKEARTVRRWGTALAAIRPEQRRRIRRLRDRLSADLESRVRITGPVHGDLHPSNILATGDGVTLIDLDNAAQGDRLLDVGRFLSALRTSALRVHGTPDGLRDAGEAFLEHYLEQVDEDPSRVRLFEAAALMTSAATGFRLQRPGWENSADLLVDEIESVMKLAGRGRPVASGVSADVPAPQKAPAVIQRKRWALDEAYVMASLAPHMRDLFQAEVTECDAEWRRGRVHGRIRYRVRGWRDGSRWHLSLEGFLRRSGGGRAAANRLAALGDALTRQPGAPVIPRLVAYVPEIGLQVMTVPQGSPIAPGMQAAPCRNMAKDLARALKLLHRTEVVLDRSLDAEEDLTRLRRDVQRLPGEQQAAKEQSLRLVDPLQAAMQGVSSQRAPVLRRLDPGHVLRVQGRIGLSDVPDVVVSHPLLDVGDFLARMGLLSLQHDHPPGLAALARTFRECYAADRAETGIFESAALLRLACSEGRRRPGDPMAGPLVALAAEALREGVSFS